MAKQEQHKISPKREKDQVEQVQSNHTDAGADVKADLDAMLDEIDEVLEENAEEMVRNYVQKGGQ